MFVLAAMTCHMDMQAVDNVTVVMQLHAAQEQCSLCVQAPYSIMWCGLTLFVTDFVVSDTAYCECKELP